MKKYILILFILSTFLNCKKDDETLLMEQSVNFTFTLLECGEPTSSLPFKVLDSNKKIVSEGTSNANGEFIIEKISPGTYDIITVIDGIDATFTIQATKEGPNKENIDAICPNPVDPSVDLEANITILNSAYQLLQSNSVFNAFGYAHLWGDFGVDILNPLSSTSDSEKDISAYTVTPDNEDILKIWSEFYKIVNRANSVIDNLRNIKNTSNNSNSKIQIEAEARFLRALSYFNLVKMYGNVISKYVMSPETNVKLTQLGAKDTYDTIIEDLKFAEINLDWANTTNIATKGAAVGLLGKVYIQMAGFPLKDFRKYTLALEQFEKLEGRYTLESNYTDVFDISNEENNSEVLFNIPFEAATGSDVFGGAHGANWGPEGLVSFNSRALDLSFIQSYSDLEISESIVKFPITIEDTRFNQNIATFNVNANGEVRNIEKIENWNPYKYKYVKERKRELFKTAFDFPYLRFADILLLTAEAENEINGGPNTKAYEVINTVRRRAFGDTNHDLPPNLSKEEFLKAILNERRLELCYEGHRRDDLIRTEKLEDVILNYNNTNSNNRRLYEATDYIWPIPQQELNISIGLKQNPGY